MSDKEKRRRGRPSHKDIHGEDFVRVTIALSQSLLSTIKDSMVKNDRTISSEIRNALKDCYPRK